MVCETSHFWLWTPGQLCCSVLGSPMFHSGDGGTFVAICSWFHKLLMLFRMQIASGKKERQSFELQFKAELILL